LLTTVDLLKFCYQLTLKQFVYLFLHLRHFKRHRKHLDIFLLFLLDAALTDECRIASQWR